ncbi:hypothetical protein F511_37912 [Dorcoceras hygrometricum]|uniref:Uncharacterized protein n=1 Tax=Dorcoceras hygrometricum TaxID=472368 RepID=A0A2Z7BZJ0_9LAMI|nr:hypothetical protein F511_37912 [Dorcoceras hygrometricum]
MAGINCEMAVVSTVYRCIVMLLFCEMSVGFGLSLFKKLRRVARWSWNEEDQQEAIVNQQLRRCARYGISYDDIRLDVITINSWHLADEKRTDGLREQSQESAGSLYPDARGSDVVEEAIQSQATVHQQMMRREVKEMKRRRAEESADGLALMTSSVTAIEERTTLVQLQYCGRNTLITQCTNRGKNEKKDEAIDRH